MNKSVVYGKTINIEEKELEAKFDEVNVSKLNR